MEKLTPMDSNSTNEKPIIHSIPTENMSNHNEIPMKKVLIVFVLVIVAGIASGFGFSYIGKAKTSTNKKMSADNSMSQKADVSETAGIADKKAFKDSAEGELEDGGHEESGTGSFKLLRPGGESQTVYLTSSTVDLSEFTGKRVRVYGETFASDKVGWLMDVGFIEVLK